MPQYVITSPDGKKYKVTAPDGASQEDVMAYVKSQHQNQYGSGKSMDVQADGSLKPSEETKYDPTEGGTNSYFDLPSLSFKERPNNSLDTLNEGIGSGMERFGRGAGNLLVKALNKVLPSTNDLSSLITGDKRAVKGGPFSDEAVRGQDALDKPLSDTTAGGIGQGIGQTLASLPLSGAVGAAGNTARAIPYAGKVLGNSFSQAAIDGALNSAAVADVDKQGQAAGAGAAAGLGITSVLKGASRLVKGLVQKSDAAEDLQHLAGQHGKDLFIPVAQAGDEEGDLASRATQALYKEGLPLIPGVTGQVKSQAKAAVGTVRDIALSEGDPTGATLKVGAQKDGLQARRDLKDAFDQEYGNTINSYAFNIPTDVNQQIQAKIKAAMPNVDDTTLKNVSDAIEGQITRYSSGQPVIDGGNLMNAKTGSNALYDSMQGPEKTALKHGIGVFDDMIDTQLKQGGNPQNLADLDKFQNLTEPYSNFKQLSAAVNAAKAQRGQFSPAQLAKSASDPGTLLHLGTTANEVLGQPVAAPSTAGRVAAYSLGALGGYHNPLLLGGAVGGANLLATKTVQKLVLGDTSAQQAVAKMVREHPEMARVVQTLIRNAGTTNVGDATHGSP